MITAFKNILIKMRNRPTLLPRCCRAVAGRRTNDSPPQTKTAEREGSLKQRTCSITSSTINSQPPYCCLEEAHLRQVSSSIKARVNQVVSVTSIVFCGQHPAGLSADYNLSSLHYTAIASAYIIINSLSEHPAVCSFQK